MHRMIIKNQAEHKWELVENGSAGAYLSRWSIDQEQMNDRNNRVLQASSGPRRYQ